MFENCYCQLKLNSDEQEIVEACLQALSIMPSTYLNVLERLSEGESSGYECAGINLESDSCEVDYLPQFKGVCFEYLDEFAVTSIEVANIILAESLLIIDFADKYKDRCKALITKGKNLIPPISKDA